MNLEIPSSWVSPSLDELIVYAIGGDWGHGPETEDEDLVLVSCIRGTEIRNWDKEHGATAALRKVRRSKLDGRALRQGDILLEISGGGPEQPVGRTVLIDRQSLSLNEGLPKIPTNFLRLLRPSSAVEPRFLDRFLRFFYASGSVAKYQGGSNNLRNLKFQNYVGITIPLPPMPEQTRIVTKIEELFSELDAGEESLRTARRQLGVYRQSLLKQAFEGKLTETWRKQNPTKLESAVSLVSRLQLARNSLGLSGSKVPIEVLDHTRHALPNIAAEWHWLRLANFAFIGSGMSVSQGRTYEDAVEVPYLRVANVQRGHLDLTEVRTMLVERSRLAELRLKAGDVLFNEGGDRDKLGRGWVWTGQIDPCITQNHVFRATIFTTSIVLPEFVSLWGNAFGQDFFHLSGKQTTNLASISKATLSSLPVPVPPVDEQKEILRLLDQQYEAVEQNEREIDVALKRSEALRQSILKKAFTGQLVPQDPNDEPASALLAHIKAERASASSSSSRSGSSSSSSAAAATSSSASSSSSSTTSPSTVSSSSSGPAAATRGRSRSLWGATEQN